MRTSSSTADKATRLLRHSANAIQVRQHYESQLALQRLIAQMLRSFAEAATNLGNPTPLNLEIGRAIGQLVVSDPQIGATLGTSVDDAIAAAELEANAIADILNAAE